MRRLILNRNYLHCGSQICEIEEEGKLIDNTIFKQMVGSLMYMTTTRHDLMYCVCLISRFMLNLEEVHMLAAKRMLRYIKSTIDLDIFYWKGCKDELVVYMNIDYAGDIDERKSTSGNVFMSSGRVVTWASKKQSVVALSTTEAEYVVAASRGFQCIWMQHILKQIKGIQFDCVTMICDISSTIMLSKNPVFHGRSKHIEKRFHFLRNLAMDEVVDMEFCGTNDKLADVMTKSLKLDQFEKIRK